MMAKKSGWGGIQTLRQQPNFLGEWTGIGAALAGLQSDYSGFDGTLYLNGAQLTWTEGVADYRTTISLRLALVTGICALVILPRRRQRDVLKMLPNLAKRAGPHRRCSCVGSIRSGLAGSDHPR